MNQVHCSRKILLITYHFPPSTAVGGLRLAGFANYLPGYGWHPYVLTPKRRKSEKPTSPFTSNSNDFTRVTATELPKILDFYLKAKLFFKSTSWRDGRSGQELSQGLVVGCEHSRQETTLRKLKRYIYSLCITLPDENRNWVAPAVMKSIFEIKKRNIGIVLTSSPPHSVQLIGLILKKLLKIKWVADFRDPWMTPFSKGLYHTSLLSNKVERGLEKHVIHNADLVLTTTELLARTLRKTYGSLAEDRFRCLPNGYDSMIFNNMSDLPKYDAFTISYTGTLYLGRTPLPIFRAIAALRDEGRIELSKIRMKLVGECEYINGESTTEVASRFGLGAIVQVMKHVPYPECLEIIRRSHLALLLASNQPYQVPAKVYDYIGAGTEVLALAELGATADLVNSGNFGGSYDPSDIAGIKEFIFSRMHEIRRFGNSGADIARFGRRTLTGQLCQELNRLHSGK